MVVPSHSTRESGEHYFTAGFGAESGPNTDDPFYFETWPVVLQHSTDSLQFAYDGKNEA